jgi:hypothetical protein
MEASSVKKGTASLALIPLSVALTIFLSAAQLSAAEARISPVLDALMTFHPGWITGSAGGPAVPVEGEYKVLFHGKGEGRITRIWLAAKDKKEFEGYKELWIQADGHTVYKGKPADLFGGKGQWQAPLVSDYQENSGAGISYAPFSYSREARVLFKGDPRSYWITYRRGAGSSSGPGYRELTEFLAEPWVEKVPAAKDKIEAAPGKPAVLAKGPLTVAGLSLRCRPEDVSKLRIRVGGQAGVPAAFFFGPVGYSGLKESAPFRSAVNYIDPVGGFMVTRLPIPLQEGEELSLETDGAALSVAYGLAVAAAKPGVRLIAQYRDKVVSGAETVPVFENGGATQFVSLIEEVSGSHLYAQERGMIRTDGVDHHLQPGAGPAGADFYEGIIYSKSSPSWRSGYRYHLLDPMVSRADLRFSLEVGKIPGNNPPAHYRTLGLAYAFDAFRLVSRTSSEPKGETALACPASFASRAGTKDAGGRGVLLVRHSDASENGQEAELWTDLRSSDCADGFLHVSAEPAAGPGGISAPRNESRYDALFFNTDASPDAPLALKQGQNIRIFDAGLPGGPFYVNDHTIARAPDGRWHLTGIFHHELADPLNEIEFIHARARAGDPAGWRGEDFTVSRGTADVTLGVDRSLGETHLWAPHIAKTDTDYVMAFHSGGPDEDSQIKIAHSADLETWTRRPLKPVFTDISTARDPMLFRAGDLWVMYYTRCDSAAAKLNGVAYRTSADLVNWSDPAMAMTLAKAPPLPNSGYTESPFVFERGGWYYLSVTSYPVEYDASFLYRSRSPFNFGDVSVARFKSHAPEWVEGGDNPGYGPLFITHAGWGQGGVWLSPVTGW